jgi:TonB family protein
MDGLKIQGTTPAQRTAKPKEPAFLVEREPWARGFFRRLHEFLTEHPVNVPPVKGPAPLIKSGFGSSFTDNLRELFQPTPRSLQGPVRSTMLVQWRSGSSIFWENLRDLVSPPKLPPLRVTSKPVKVRDIWSKNELYSRAQGLSVLVHILAGLILIFPFIHSLSTPTEAKETTRVTINLTDYSPYAPKLPPGKDPAGGGGGGGERNPVPASKGKLPKFSLQPQLTPPVVKIQNPNPKLAVDPTLFIPPDIRLPSPNLPNTGDPLSAMLNDSAGPGFGGGIGTGSGGGIGSGSGGGLGPGEGGGTGGGAFRPGRNGVGYPACAYCPLPMFSEEARKAKHQGTVTLHVIITPDGRATDISVVQGLGLGLDEKAMEAVRTWRFTPALGPGNKPVPVSMNIEVVFRLL